MLELFNNLNTIEEVESFIQGASADTNIESRENTNIEYKQADQRFSNTNEIGKDVSAFANSEGGIIFYGVTCDADDRTKPQNISGLHPANIESFDRIINSHIHYPIKGIQKKLISPHDPRVMLLYIPQSDESPHQNGDGKYYIRMGTESRPMPHYLVELHFGKRRKPKLSVELSQFQQPQLPSFNDSYSPLCRSSLGIQNSGKAIAKYVQAIFLFPPDARGSEGNGPVMHLKHQSPGIKDISDRYPGKIAWLFRDNQEIIHPTTSLFLGTFQFLFHRNLILDPAMDVQAPILEWIVNAEGMEPQQGQENIWSFFSP